MVNASTVAFKHIAKSLIDQAVKYFGTTTDFSKGAWLLPDGSLLNFSNGHGRKDHSDIKKIFPENLKEQDPEKYVPENEYIRSKFLAAGAIRLVAEGGGVEITQEPTGKQLTKINEFFKWLPRSEFFIDLSGKGQPIKKMYENTEDERSKALITIEKYFKGQLKSLSEIQNFRYSDETRRHIEGI
jgi:hypothetical protein